jgi:hypothetical protein
MTTVKSRTFASFEMELTPEIVYQEVATRNGCRRQRDLQTALTEYD